MAPFLPTARRPISTPALAAGVALALLLGVGCRTGVTPAPGAAPASEPTRVESNVERKDYAGSAACEPCHSALYAKWAASPMRRMTRLAGGAEIHAPFDGTVFRFHGDTVTVEQREGRRYMRVQSQTNGAQLFLVTRVVGGRYREDFVGRQVAGEEADSPTVGDALDEPVLPISWLVFDGTWRYKGYSVMVKERPHLGADGAPWRKTCIFCHNTVPYLGTIFDDLAGGGRPYQGSISDGFLPEDRAWKAKMADKDLLARSLRAEIALVESPNQRVEKPGRTVEELLGDAIQIYNLRFGEKHLVEVGIGCEACHNGAREHAKEPNRKPSFEPRSPLLSTSTPGPARQGAPGKAEWINHTCVRCHTVLFSRYPFTWEGGTRKLEPGGSSTNSGEARDFLLGGCASQMACTSCHDPHGADPRDKLDAFGTVAGNKTCLACHARYSGDAALGAHTHHKTDGAGSACLSCHMPRKNSSLTYALTRYHRIGSPTDKNRVERDRPLECALCHADQSVAGLVETMEAWWGRRYDREALQRLYGEDLGVNVLAGTLVRGKPHEQLVAAGVIGDAGRTGHAASLLGLLGSEYPQVRYYARAALEKLFKKKLAVDLDGDAATIQAQASAWLEEASAPSAGKK